MKQIISILLINLCFVFFASAQIDRSIRPLPGPAPKIQLGEFESFRLRNGLQVIVVENRQVPIVSFQLTLEVDPILEGEAKGFVDLAGSMMREGTKNRTKAQIDEELDFIGATLGTFSSGMFGSALTRHKEALLAVMSDVLLNPTFPEEELQRNLTQMRSALEASRNDANFMANNVLQTVVYGPGHPYSEVTTPQSLELINTEMMRNYHKTFFRPNVAYLVIVGDIDVREARRLARRYFGRWRSAPVPEINHPTPTLPAGKRVAFVNRPGAIQSDVNIAYPIVFTPANPDAIKVSVLNNILGGGVFSGRLMQNLREDKGWTYGARSRFISDPLIGRFTASTEVRNSVTDSTVVEILNEMRRLIYEPVDEETLQLVKNFMSGSFARSLESPRTIANFALNIKRFDLPEDYYENYLENLSRVTAQDVQAMAAKYLKPDNAFIVVVGNRDEVLPTLKPFSASGYVYLFDAFGRPVEAPREVAAEITAQDILNRYITAIGGEQNLRKIQDVTTTMTATIQGMTINSVTKQKSPNLLLATMSMGGNVLQKQVFDGTRGRITAMGQSQELSGVALEDLKLQAILFPELQLQTLGFQMEVTGMEQVDGKDAYNVKITSPTGRVRNEFFCKETGFRLSTHVSQDTPMGPMVIITQFADYRKVNNVYFPHSVKQQLGPQMIDMKVNSIEFNTGLTIEQFKVD